jgi:hypothetical protein
MKKGISAAIFLTLFFLGCRQHQNDAHYAEDPGNGLKKEVAVGEMVYTIQYKPAGFIVEKEHLDSAAAAERLRQLSGMVWFNISFSIKGFGQSPLRYKITGIDEYTQRQNYYLNQAPADIYLLYGNDSLLIDSYWFENNQNLAPFETMIVGFKLPAPDTIPVQDLRLAFFDRVFKNGIIKCVIKKEDINN